ADEPAADKPADKPAADKPAADEPAADEPADKPAADEPVAVADEYLKFEVGHIQKPEDVAVGMMSFKLVKAKVNGEDIADPSNFAEFEVDLSTVNTGNEARDKHLKNPDFFDIEKFATATFTVKDIKTSGDAYTATAVVNLHGVEQAVPVKFSVVDKDDASIT